MGILPNNQRDQMKVAIAVVAIALGGWYYMYPYAERAADIETARAHVEQLEAQNEKARLAAAHNDVGKLRDEAERAGAGLEIMRRLVPTEHEVPALLEEISTAARRTNLEIGGVAPEPVLKGEEFDTYRYKVSVVGGYHALTTFLANVGSLPRIVAPVNFTLAITPDASAAKPASGKPAPLAASVTLQAYVVHPHTTVDTASKATAHASAAGEVAGDVATALVPVAEGTPPKAIARPVSRPAPAPRRPAKVTTVTIERETFGYAGGGRRDPFKSLLTTAELRPMLAELKLVAVAYDPAGNSVAILRDINTKQQHRVRTGTLLGRMRVAAIRPKAVVFTIEELGFSRQETLGLNDSTAVRGK